VKDDDNNNNDDDDDNDDNYDNKKDNNSRNICDTLTMPGTTRQRLKIYVEK